MASLDRIRNHYTLIETWDLDYVAMRERVEEFDRMIASIRAEAWEQGHLDVCTDCCCDFSRINPYRQPRPGTERTGEHA